MLVLDDCLPFSERNLFVTYVGFCTIGTCGLRLIDWFEIRKGQLDDGQRVCLDAYNAKRFIWFWHQLFEHRSTRLFWLYVVATGGGLFWNTRTFGVRADISVTCLLRSFLYRLWIAVILLPIIFRKSASLASSRFDGSSPLRKQHRTRIRITVNAIARVFQMRNIDLICTSVHYDEFRL